jgi:DNA-binding protein H-NS
MAIENFSAVIATAEAIRRTKEQEAKDALIREFRERTAKLGLSMSDLLPAKAPRKERKDSRTTPAVKYRSPSGETWSGRGIAPKWIQAMENEGRNREEFRVQAQTA